MAERNIDSIYIHCSASKWGSFSDVDSWHGERGFTAYYSDYHKKKIHIGYHFLVLNAYPTADSLKKEISSSTDGQIIEGRPLSIIGAHVRGANTTSIGAAFVGFTPTPMQVNSLVYLSLTLMEKYSIPISRIFMHHEYFSNHNLPMTKTCPNFSGEAFRKYLELYI